MKVKPLSKDKVWFCIEGTHLLEELLKSDNKPEKIIATEEWVSKNSLLIKNIESSIFSLVSKDALASALSTKNPDGVAAIVKKSSIGNSSYDKKDDFILVLDRIQDPGNVGNLFRTALAGGVNNILLAGGANPLSQKVLRSSCGSVFHMPFRRIEGEEDDVINDLLISLNEISKKGFQIVLTSGKNDNPKKSLKPYWELNWSRPTVLILGNEGSGIHYKIKEAFNETITIQHNQLVESLNVACVAVPLLLERKRAALTTNSENKK